LTSRFSLCDGKQNISSSRVEEDQCVHSPRARSMSRRRSAGSRSRAMRSSLVRHAPERHNPGRIVDVKGLDRAICRPGTKGVIGYQSIQQIRPIALSGLRVEMRVQKGLPRHFAGEAWLVSHTRRRNSYVLGPRLGRRISIGVCHSAIARSNANGTGWLAPGGFVRLWGPTACHEEHRQCDNGN
jgi:hypothetical protein